MSRHPARSQEERIERRRAARLRCVQAKRAPRPTPPATGPVSIPSEARMLRNLERAWGAAEPGEMGLRTHDEPAKHPDDLFDA